MLETRSIAAPHGFECRLVRDPDGREIPGWFVMVCDAEHDELWLCVATAPVGIELSKLHVCDEHIAGLLPKLCALLGMEWALFEADFLPLAGWQQACQAGLGDAMRHAIALAPVEDIARWREEITRNESALVRAAITGEDPRAVSN
ncbi:MAG TPA: hypothetical protein VK506_11575 [Conexibacter sp.]|nr:hypothetical protein [Conexibacter sp.]